MEEYKETKERYDFLSKQITDLEEAKKSLENIIKRLETDMKRMFAEAVEKIGTSFKRVFTELFRRRQCGNCHYRPGKHARIRH